MQEIDEEELRARKEAEMEAAKRKKFDEEFEALKRQLQVLKSANDYMEFLEMSKSVATTYAEAVVDGNRELEIMILQQHIQTLKAKWLKEFQRTNKGNVQHKDNGESKAVRLVRTLPNYNTSIDEEALRPYM